MIYAGIGSRNIQGRSSLITDITFCAKWLEKKGYLLRSGGALGCDKVFEEAVSKQNAQIFKMNDATNESMLHAAKFHPAWNKLNLIVKKLHGRNSMIIMGEKLDNPVDFVLCYTTDGKASGGTGQGIRVANYYNIPVFNLYKKSKNDFVKFFNSLQEQRQLGS